MSLLDRLQKNSTIKLTSILEDSKIFNNKDMIPTSIPMLNVALSGSLDGGLGPGLTLFCGKSKHFKSLFTLILAKAYMDKYPDAVFLFYDSEFGTPIAYFKALGFDMSRIIHSPLTDIEVLKFDLMQQLETIERGDHLFIAVDSIGNLASKKEVDDALKGNSAADMTRAKQLKSLFRMVTPHLTIKDIPMVCVNHIYMTQEMFAKAVVSGGDGIYLSSDNIYIIGRQQEKDGGTDVEGYHFIINVEKSRHVIEKSKIPITVMHNSGLNKYSGLIDVAEDGGFITKPKKGWYCKVDQETGELEEKNYKPKDMNNAAFWDPILKSKKFLDYIETTYKVSSDMLIKEEVLD